MLRRKRYAAVWIAERLERTEAEESRQQQAGDRRQVGGEVPDLLGNAVLQHLEVFGGEPGDEAAPFVGHHHIERDARHSHHEAEALTEERFPLGQGGLFRWRLLGGGLPRRGGDSRQQRQQSGGEQGGAHGVREEP